MAKALMHIPSLEEYAKIKKINFDYNNVETLEVIACEECRYCRPGVNACIFGNKVRNLDNVTTCPRVAQFV